MAVEFDEETLARFRNMPSLQVYNEAKNAVYRSGAVSSDDFLDVFEILVDRGILSWDQIREFER